ncbi:hypothetical protein [Burkholderia sp. Ac-20365]|jgi:hypothetical protein|uniref:hypothetical protein n=1 Tax=Burkholderia sp. Ac-20365 TaxID=2703897 RepID=UPI00197BF1E4|nr:hypothetical protein [Burkholderia sp. Ac-20365]
MFWQAPDMTREKGCKPREVWAKGKGVGKMTPVRDYSECVARSLARRHAPKQMGESNAIV